MNQFERILFIQRSMDVQDFLFFGNFSPTEKENGTVITYPIEL